MFTSLGKRKRVALVFFDLWRVFCLSVYCIVVVVVVVVALRKHAYLNILKISPSKTEIFR